MQECQDTFSNWISGQPRKPCNCVACTGRQALQSRFPGLFQLTVAPDGSHLVFVNVLRAGSELWVARPDGTQSRRLCLTAEQEDILFPRFTADGKSVFFTLEGESHHGIRRVELLDGRCTTITRGRDWGPFPLPDGRHVAYCHMVSSKKGHVVLLDLAAGTVRRLTSRLGSYGVMGYEHPHLIYIECKGLPSRGSTSLIEFCRVKV